MAVITGKGGKATTSNKKTTKKKTNTEKVLKNAFSSSDTVKVNDNSTNKTTKLYGTGKGEVGDYHEGLNEASDSKTKVKDTKPTKLTGDGSTKTASHEETKKKSGSSTTLSKGGISGQKVTPETSSDKKTTTSISSKSTPQDTPSQSTPTKSTTTQSAQTQNTQTQSTIDVPLEKVEDAIRREWTPVESYDPYADEQYNKQLQEYKDSIAGEYARQREESDAAYEKNKAAADIAALRRGMGRSSYNLQTMANIDTEKAKASQQISDKEAEAAQQFGVQLASELRNNYQWETAQNYQRERDTWSDYYQQQSLNQNQQSLNMQAQQNEIARQQADRNYNYQASRDQVADQQWQQNFEYQQGRDAVADQQWNQNFEYQQGRDKVSDEQWNKNFEYQQGRDTVSDQQWQQTFEQNQKIADQNQQNTERQLSNTEQQIWLSYCQNAAQNGGTVTDEMLKKAGLTRKDYNAMKKKSKKSSSGGSKGGTTPQQTPQQTTPTDSGLEDQAGSTWLQNTSRKIRNALK